MKKFIAFIKESYKEYVTFYGKYTINPFTR